MRVATDDGFTEAMTTIPPNPEEALVTISTPKSDTVRVKDRVESSRFEFYFDDDVDVEEVTTDTLFFPLDVAVRMTGPWREVSVPMSTAAFVHDHESGEIIERVSKENPSVKLEPGSYEIKLLPAPVKVYLGVDSGIEIQLADDQIYLRLESEDEIIAGVRSPHEKPAGTIETTSSPEDLMEAVSHLGSALKTTSPERSWPSLRGYPPNIEVGKAQEIPPTITRHDVNVQLEVPYDIQSIFQVAPLAYYTSASVVPLPDDESVPGFIAADTRIPLEGDLGRASAELLQRNVLLDSVVRSVGIYPFMTHERRVLEDSLPWSLQEVYDLPLGDRICLYCDVPQEDLDSVWPQWPLTIDINGTLDEVPAIPHIAEQLAVVRIPDLDVDSPNQAPSYVSDFIRADGSGSARVTRTSGATQIKKDIVQPADWDTQMHTTLRAEYPLGSNATSIRAYERHLERESPDTNAIEVHVVCNDDEMREEDIVSEFYGVRDLLEFDVNIHYTLTTKEFKSLLQESFDLIHYIGHVDEAGIKCKDGYLDARTDIDEVGFEAFLLNACRSVEQGEALLDAGAAGGIATLYDVPNSSATKLGRTLSRLLNRGFTAMSALEISRTASYLGNRWVSLGDGRVTLTQPESGVPTLAKVEPCEEGFELEIEWYETASYRIGATVTPNTEWSEPRVLPSSQKEIVTTTQLEEAFSLEVMPVKCGRNLYWTDEVSPKELREQYEESGI